MANDSQADVYNPKGQLGAIPASELPLALANGYRTRDSVVEAIHPTTGETGLIPKEDWAAAQAQMYAPTPRQAAYDQTKSMPMQTSPLPKAVRTTAQALPALGGLGGGILGAAGGTPTVAGIPLGAVAGAGLGAAAGEQAKQNVLNRIFNEGPSPTSKEGLTDTAYSAALGSTSELGGAVLSGYGNLLLKRLATAQSAGQVGDAVQALRAYTKLPGVTQDSIVDGLNVASNKLSGDLTRTLQSAQGTVDLDSAVLNSVRARAASEDAAFARVKIGKPGFIGPQPQVASARITNKVNDVIAAAKAEAGITGSTANAQQLANFQRAVQREAYKVSKIAGVGSVAQDVLQDAFSGAGRSLRMIAPDTDRILEQMADIHAAKSALANYPLPRFGATAVSAATHPVTTAIASPAVTGAAVFGGPKTLATLRKTLGR